ncbi:MAG TPA: VOC family protein [Terriglobales bacterium]|nr:VOC family protein [Terriglobales bacterium]
MTAKAGYSTPSLHVADVARSLRFYELLGFETIDTDGEGGRPPTWARMHCEGGALMFLKTEVEERVPLPGSGPDRFLLYMYTPDPPGLRDHLVAGGVEVPPIQYPEYMSSGEIMLKDPDGHVVLVGHWGKPEHEAWEKRLGEKKKSAPGT